MTSRLTEMTGYSRFRDQLSFMACLSYLSNLRDIATNVHVDSATALQIRICVICPL